MRLRAGLLVIACARIAAAQSAPATKLFEEGRQLLADKKPAEACVKFEQALALEPEDLGVMLNLGLCNEELDKIASALEWFRRAKVRASELKAEESETAAKEKTGALASKVATLKVELATRPAGFAVKLDGAKIEEADLGRIEVDAGHHVIEATAPDTQLVHRELDMTDAKSESVRLELVPIAKPKPVASEPTAIVVDRGASDRRHAYILGAAGAGLLVATGAFTLYARHEFGATEHPDVKQQWDNALLYGATPAAVIGAAAVAGAVYLYMHAPERETVVTPTASGHSVGFVLHRTF